MFNFSEVIMLANKQTNKQTNKPRDFVENIHPAPLCNASGEESLALASMARDDPPTSSTAAAMRGKVGSEFETEISYNAPMQFRHRQTDRQTDTDISR